jgi:hypothetical protein
MTSVTFLFFTDFLLLLFQKFSVIDLAFITMNRQDILNGKEIQWTPLNGITLGQR